MRCKLVATRPGHDADASREPARSYARDLGAHSECSRETARQPLACMGVQVPEDCGAAQQPKLWHERRESNSARSVASCSSRSHGEICGC